MDGIQVVIPFRSGRRSNWSAAKTTQATVVIPFRSGRRSNMKTKKKVTMEDVVIPFRSGRRSNDDLRNENGFRPTRRNPL